MIGPPETMFPNIRVRASVVIKGEKHTIPPGTPGKIIQVVGDGTVLVNFGAFLGNAMCKESEIEPYPENA